MSQVSELKCPHCGEWTLWKGHIDDRCLYCDEFLEPKKFSREVEKKIRAEVIKESDYFFIHPDDGLFTRSWKGLLNSFRWLMYYVQIAFFLFISLLLVLLSLFAG